MLPAERTTTYYYFTLLLVMGLVGAILGPALPALQQNVGVTTETIALLFTAKAFGAMVGAFGIGRMYDRFVGHKVMSLALGLLLPTFVATPFIHSFSLLLLLTFVGGVCEGGLHVGANTLLVRLHREKVTPYMNGLHFAFGIGAVLAPALLGVSYSIGTGILGVYIAIALIVALLPLLFLRTPTPEPHSPLLGNDETVPRMRSLPVLLGVIFFLYVGAEGTFSGWIYSYVIARDLADKTSAAMLTALFWTGLTVGRLLGIFLAKRFAPQQILPFDMLFGILAVVWIALLGETFSTLAIGTTVYGFAIASIFPMTMAFAGEKMKLTGNVTGLFFVGAAAGGMTMPWLVGQFFESYGPETVLAIALLSLGLAVVILGITRLSVGKSYQ